MKVKEESEKAHLKLKIQKQRSRHLVPSLHDKQIGNKMETVTDFIFLGSKIAEDCSHEIKRCQLLGRKALASLDSILKMRHCFANKGPYSQRYFFFFPIVMYRYESWTIKKAECQGIDAFKLWCWRRLLRVSWTARK